MCSSTVADPANMSRQGSTLCSPAVGKILCRTLFSKRSHVGNLRQTNNQKEVGVKRVETLMSTLLPRRGARHVPAVRRRRIPSLRFSEKLPAHQGRTRLRQFVSPAQPVLKKTAARIGRTR